MNYKGDLIIGIRRRKIEDQIIEKFRKVNFNQEQGTWLDDPKFWDYVFAWHDLARYYEETQDTTLGSVMLDLYTFGLSRMREAAQNRALQAHRRSQANDALHQMAYFLNQVMIEIDKNTRPQDDHLSGQIRW